MFQKNEDAQMFGVSANRSKKYVTPCVSIIAVETATLLAGSGPEASIEDILNSAALFFAIYFYILT